VLCDSDIGDISPWCNWLCYFTLCVTGCVLHGCIVTSQTRHCGYFTVVQVWFCDVRTAGRCRTTAQTGKGICL